MSTPPCLIVWSSKETRFKRSAPIRVKSGHLLIWIRQVSLSNYFRLPIHKLSSLMIWGWSALGQFQCPAFMGSLAELNSRDFVREHRDDSNGYQYEHSWRNANQWRHQLQLQQLVSKKRRVRRDMNNEQQITVAPFSLHQPSLSDFLVSRDGCLYVSS